MLVVGFFVAAQTKTTVQTDTSSLPLSPLESVSVVAISDGTLGTTKYGEDTAEKNQLIIAPLSKNHSENQADVSIFDTRLLVEAANTATSTFDAVSGARDVALFGNESESQQLGDPLAAVTSALDEYSEAGFETGFIVYDFASGRGLSYNVDAEFFSASTIKAPYVAYVWEGVVDAGGAAPEDQIEEDYLMEGTGIMATDDQYVYDLKTVLENTIVHSDNTGYALLRERYDAGFYEWAADAGVEARAWMGEWFPYYTPRDLAKLWLKTEQYLAQGSGSAALLEESLIATDASFIRQVLGDRKTVLSKAGFEVDTPFYDMDALSEAGIVCDDDGNGAYLLVVMSDAGYDDTGYTVNEPLITNLIAALAQAHDSVLV